MEIRARYVIIGLFTVGVFALALIFLLWMSRAGIDRTTALYDIVFTEAVTGLSRGSLVQYNGIKVGEVSSLALAPDDPRKVLARITLDGGTPVREDTRAKLGLQGVTGVAYIQLSGGSPESPPLMPTRENPVPVIASEESALSKLLASGADIAVTVNETLLRVSDLFSHENVAHVSTALGNIDDITSSIAEQRGSMAQALQELAGATAELHDTLQTIDRTAADAGKLLREDGHKTLAATQEALGSINEVVQSLNGLVIDNRAAIESFSNQGLRQLGPALVELRETLRALNRLGDQLGDSNNILLRSDRPREYEPN